MEFLLDSAILIDRFNRSPRARSYLSSIRGKAAISVVTRAEVLTGFDQASLRTAIRFLDFFPTLEITKPVPTSPRVCAASTVGSCPTLSRRPSRNTTG